MSIAMLSPIAWRTPPRHYGPWESVVSLLTEGLVSRGYNVILFATGDSETSGKLHAVCARGYEEDRFTVDSMVEKYIDVYTEVHEKVHKDFVDSQPNKN